MVTVAVMRIAIKFIIPAVLLIIEYVRCRDHKPRYKINFAILPLYFIMVYYGFFEFLEYYITIPYPYLFLSHSELLYLIADANTSAFLICLFLIILILRNKIDFLLGAGVLLFSLNLAFPDNVSIYENGFSLSFKSKAIILFLIFFAYVMLMIVKNRYFPDKINIIKKLWMIPGVLLLIWYFYKSSDSFTTFDWILDDIVNNRETIVLEFICNFLMILLFSYWIANPRSKNSADVEGPLQGESDFTPVLIEEVLSPTESIIRDIEKSLNGYRPSRDGYYFENEAEYDAYVKLHSDKAFSWTDGDKYSSIMQMASDMFDDENYEGAIRICSLALKCNPVGLSARFKMFESHFAMQSYSKAKIVLNNMSQYLSSNVDIAHFYRSYGAIEGKLSKYGPAIACCQYSLLFEDNDEAIKEIDAYKSIYKKYDLTSDPVASLEKNEIPVISKNKAPLLKNKMPESKKQNVTDIQPEHETVGKHEHVGIETDERIKPDSNGAHREIKAKAVKQPTSNIRFCRKCGAELIGGAMFCKSCGTKVM